jgi:hypothetical protein
MKIRVVSEGQTNKHDIANSSLLAIFGTRLKTKTWNDAEIIVKFMAN